MSYRTSLKEKRWNYHFNVR